MPFAGFADFDDCVRKNQDKDDPAAFCGFLKKRSEGESLSERLITLQEKLNKR